LVLIKFAHQILQCNLFSFYLYPYPYYYESSLCFYPEQVWAIRQFPQNQIEFEPFMNL